MLALSVFHVVNGNFRVVFWSLWHLGEGEAVELVSQEKQTIFHHVFELEIWANIVFTEVVLFCFHLFCEVVVVPCFNLVASTVSVGIFLHIGHFLVHFLHSWLPDAEQKVFGCIYGLSHHWVDSVVGKGLETEQFRLLLAELENGVDVLAVVKLVATVSGCHVGFVHFFTE